MQDMISLEPGRSVHLRGVSFNDTKIIMRIRYIVESKRKYDFDKYSVVVQLTTRTTEDRIPEFTRIPEKIATTEHFI